MIDLSLAGLTGAVIGIVVAAVAYAPLVLLVERGFKARQPAATSEEQQTLALELSLLRRGGLAVDIIVFAGIGYLVGPGARGGGLLGVAGPRGGDGPPVRARPEDASEPP